MAGTFVTAGGQRWSAASWLFYWVLRTIASHVDAPDLQAKFREIDNNNLGWFSLQDCSALQCEQVLAAVCTSLTATAERDFQTMMVNRENLDRLVARLRALVSICCDEHAILKH